MKEADYKIIYTKGTQFCFMYVEREALVINHQVFSQVIFNTGAKTTHQGKDSLFFFFNEQC